LVPIQCGASHLFLAGESVTFFDGSTLRRWRRRFVCPRCGADNDIPEKDESYDCWRCSEPLSAIASRFVHKFVHKPAGRVDFQIQVPPGLQNLSEGTGRLLVDRVASDLGAVIETGAS
jgi:hypothetical protein